MIESLHTQLFKADRHLYHAPEGTGKSQFAITLIKDEKYKVFFCTETNQQADEKAENFASQGINVYRLRARSAKLELMGHGHCCVFNANSNYFDTDQLNKGATIQQLSMKLGSLPRAKTTWDQCISDEFDGDHEMVVCTRHQMRHFLPNQSFKWIVFFDDMNTDSVRRMAPAKVSPNGKGFLIPEGAEVEYTKVSKDPKKDFSQYIVRPKNKYIDYGITSPCVFTTSEHITAKMIIENFGANRLIVENQEVPCSKTIIIPTCRTRHSQGDCVMPLIAMYLTLQGVPTKCYGDAMGGLSLTHKSIKGNNSLTEYNSIISADKLHGKTVFEYKAEFRIPFDDTIAQRKLELELMNDQVRQSGSRAGWHRWNGVTYHIILADHAYAKGLSASLGYPHIFYESEKHALKAAKKSDNSFFKEVCEFIKCPATYATKKSITGEFLAIDAFKFYKTDSDLLEEFKKNLEFYVIAPLVLAAIESDKLNDPLVADLEQLIREINDLMQTGHY